MIRFRTLGALELRAGGGRELLSVLAQPKRTALLAYLTIAGARGGCRRDSLLGLLWPEAAQDRARHSLNQAVYGLRRSLGPAAIVSLGTEQLAIDPSLLWCDAVAFEAALEAGELEKALELHRGPLLEGFFLADAPQFVEWLDLERVRLRDRAVFAAWALADREEAAGNAAGAALWARRAGALSPDDELVLRRVLSTLARLGDRSGAMATYDAFASRLAADPGIAPADETVELAERIRGAPVGTAAPARVEWRAPELPQAATPLIGRRAEREQLYDLLRGPDCRLATLTGPGGIGKTRLAQEVAAGLAATFHDGVQLVWLAGLDDADRVPNAVVQALRLAPSATDVREQLARELANRDLLLVLDNFDQLIDAAGFVTELLERTHAPKLLVTSRQPLGLRAEWVVRLGGLSVPPEDDIDDVDASEAATLFRAAAARASGRVEADALDAACVARICRLVEGVPLAVELAAAWTRVLTCGEIRAEIERSRRFLGGSLRDVPERHRSLWAAFEQSWNRLNPSERAAFRGLAVFRSGFTRAAAMAVTRTPLDTLAALVDKSILRRSGSGRFEMLESLREFAWEKLNEAEGALDLEDRHALYYAEFLREFDDALSGALKDDALRAISGEIDNVRAAWSAAVRRSNLQVLGAATSPLFGFYDCRGWYTEARSVFADAAAALARREGEGEVMRVRAALLARQGAACWRLGEREQAQALLEGALACARSAGDAGEAAFALDRLAILAYEVGEYAEGERLVSASLALRRELGDMRGIAMSLNNLGSMAYAVGDYPSALRFCEDCLVLQRRSGDTAGLVISLQNLGYISLVLGEPDRAAQHLSEALVVAHEAGSGLLIARARLNLGNLASAVGDAALACGHFRAALAHGLGARSDALAIEALLGLCASLRRTGEAGHALALATLIARHPAADATARAQAEQLIEETRAELAPVQARAAAARGRGLRLEAVLEQIPARGPATLSAPP